MRGAAAALLAVTMSACVSHPVGPARTYAKYEGKAVTTAEAALSAVESGRLVARSATRHRLPGAYVGATLGEAEDAVAGVSGTFASIQPPDERADQLRNELGSLLHDAAEHLAQLRIAARRGQIGDLASLSAPLAGDADKLEAFTKAHQ
jgi:hypothetical protein